MAPVRQAVRSVAVVLACVILVGSAWGQGSQGDPTAVWAEGEALRAAGDVAGAIAKWRAAVELAEAAEQDPSSKGAWWARLAHAIHRATFPDPARAEDMRVAALRALDWAERAEDSSAKLDVLGEVLAIVGNGVLPSSDAALSRRCALRLLQAAKAVLPEGRGLADRLMFAVGAIGWGAEDGPMLREEVKRASGLYLAEGCWDGFSGAAHWQKQYCVTHGLYAEYEGEEAAQLEALRAHEPGTWLLAQALTYAALCRGGIREGLLAQGETDRARGIVVPTIALWSEAAACARTSRPDSRDLVGLLSNAADMLCSLASAFPAGEGERFREAARQFWSEAISLVERHPAQSELASTAAVVYTRSAWTRFGWCEQSPEEVLAQFRRALDYQRRNEPSVKRFWEVSFFLRVLRRDTGAWQAVAEFWREQVALEHAAQSPSMAEASAHAWLGEALQQGGDYAAAAAEFREAVHLHDSLEPYRFPGDEHSDVKQHRHAPQDWLGELAECLANAGDLTGAVEARTLQHDAQALWASDGDDVWSDQVSCLQALVDLCLRLDRREEASGYASELETLAALHDPRSPVAAALWQRIGREELTAGRLVEADAALRRSMEVWRRAAPESREAGLCLGDLTECARLAGDLDLAAERGQTVLDHFRRTAPGSPELAQAMDDLGMVEFDRGNLEQARGLVLESLEARKSLAPDSPELAASHNHAGMLLAVGGQVEEAVAEYRASLAIEEKRDPASLAVAQGRNNLGRALFELGDAEGSRAELSASLELLERLAPESASVAVVVANVGALALSGGDPSTAARHFARALDLATRHAPASAQVAELHYALGAVAEQQGDRAKARTEYGLAISLIERARERAGLGGSERSRFLTRYTHLYEALIALLVADGASAEAGNVAERMRARSMAEEIIERPVLWASETPVAVSARQRLDARRNALYQRMWAASDEGALLLSADLAAIDAEEEALVRSLRRDAPRLSWVLCPEPLSLEAIAATLAPGTLALMYVVGSERSWLVAFGPAREATAHVLLANRQSLAEDVSLYLRTAKSRSEAVGQLGAEVASWLLGPVAEELRTAKRVVILPDGPLTQLPFQALPVAGAGALCDLAPVSYAPSGSLLARRSLEAQTRQAAGMLAIGDPELGRLDAGQAASDRLVAEAARALRDVAGSDLALGRLPFAGAELDAVAAAGGPDALRLAGPEATEARFRQEAPGKSILHFATHGLSDARHPLDSALALAFEEQSEPANDGLLRAREILGLDLGGCDLACLSACDTARGEVVSGEGVLGLARAFLVAGAASVVCSQWAVADDSTAALMSRFYGHLASGAPKDVALQRAMREIRTGRSEDGSALILPEGLGAWREEWSEPYHWAPFVLVGQSD